jgi:hypothetical protein
VVRIDNLKTRVAAGAGSTGVLNRTYEIFGRTCGFEIDPCRPSRARPQATVVLIAETRST